MKIINKIVVTVAATIILLPLFVSAQEYMPVRGEHPQSIDDEFYAIAQDSPAFGGLYLCGSDGGLCVNMTDVSPATVAEVRAAIDRRFGEQFHGMPTIPVPAEFGFAQLFDWYQLLGHVLSISGVVFTDIDERRNRITIGVSTNSAMKAVKREIARLNIPDEAVAIDDSEPIVTLDDKENVLVTVAGWFRENWPFIGVGGALLALGIYRIIRRSRR